ncbi:hypothetical protein PILCRDRAFT_595494 [Piloderma croceum F 1598]|uniref:Uncharacterized protein n=1 Tax=Piloderma croceum (strain F 1598) TaxID=765440 RepID=A0A0C3FED3_PILCF|nr:hypothetical protein PILCRDRAFT_595494 [Piloderma croceum F 1598]
MQTMIEILVFGEPKNVTSNRGGEMDDGKDEPWEEFGGEHSANENGKFRLPLSALFVTNQSRYRARDGPRYKV